MLPDQYPTTHAIARQLLAMEDVAAIQLLPINKRHTKSTDMCAYYLIERGHHSRPGKWKVVGKFVAGSPWRDGRPVDDETMREEIEGYRRTWPDYLARVRCSNGEILSDSLDLFGETQALPVFLLSTTINGRKCIVFGPMNTVLDIEKKEQQSDSPKSQTIPDIQVQYTWIDSIGLVISKIQNFFSRIFRRPSSNRWRSIDDLPPRVSREEDWETRCVVVWQDADHEADIGAEVTNLEIIRDGDFHTARYHNPMWLSLMDAPAFAPKNNQSK